MAADDLVIKLLLLGMIHLVPIRGIKGCFEEERKALLEFKAFVKSDGHDADHLLPSWVNDPEDDCCKWERVVCDSTTGRAVDLSLDNIRQFDIHSPSLYHKKNSWYLKTTSFHPFKELRSLNLSANGIAGWIQDEESPVFKNLQMLDLRFNKLSSRPLAGQVQATRGEVSFHSQLELSWNFTATCGGSGDDVIIQCCKDGCRKKFPDCKFYSESQLTCTYNQTEIRTKSVQVKCFCRSNNIAVVI